MFCLWREPGIEHAATQMNENVVDITAYPLHGDQKETPPRSLHQASQVTARSRRRRARLRQILWAYVFIAPFCVIFLLFNVWPYAYSLILSFERYSGFGNATSVGFSNYGAILGYHVFWSELGNTLFYWLTHAVILIPLSFGMALLVRSRLIRGMRFWKPIIFLPQVMTIVAVSLVFQTLFSTQYGVINQLFQLHLAWLQDPTFARWVVVLLLVWQGLGFWFIVFLAGLTSIDPSLEEAAIVDGATAWQRLRFVIIPLMRNIFLFAFAIDAINSMRLYTQPNVLISPSSPLDPRIAPVLNLLVTDLNGSVFGQSSAVGWLLFITTIVISALIFGIFRATGGLE